MKIIVVWSISDGTIAVDHYYLDIDPESTDFGIEADVRGISHCQQTISRSAINVPSFEVNNIKLDLPSKFMGKLSELNGWVLPVEQYCSMVSINKPTDMVKFAISYLEGDAFTWQQQLAYRRLDFEVGMLVWSEFQSELVNAFIDMNRELKLCQWLASLKQQTNIKNCTKQFWELLLELEGQAPDESALLFMFTEELKSDVWMSVLLEQPQFHFEAKYVVERADKALFLSEKCQLQQGQQQPRQLLWQYRWYGFQKPPPLPPRQGPMPIDLGDLQGQYSNLQTLPQRTPAWQVNYYRCGKQGHMVKDCWVRLRGQPTQQQPNFVWVQSPVQYQQPYMYQQFLLQQFQPTFSHMYTQLPQHQVPQFWQLPSNYMYMAAQQQPQSPPQQTQQLLSAPPLNNNRDRY